MKTKNKLIPPKILILTQINPINVAYVYDEICADYKTHNEVFSAQIMALLGETALKENENDNIHSYRVFNAAFVKNIKAAVQKMNPLKPWIFIGNCAKNSVKFDYVIGFDGGEDFGNSETFDYYIAADNAALTEANMRINYYDRQDADYFFPTIQHLKLFLDTIGVRKDEDSDGDSTK